jgi:hypothetical protein
MLPKSTVTINRKIRTSLPGYYAEESNVEIYTGLMRIVNGSESNPYNQIQIHAQAEYLAYIEEGMPKFFVGDVIDFESPNNYSGSKKITIKKIKPMTLRILNRVAEAYCDSFND